MTDLSDLARGLITLLIEEQGHLQRVAKLLRHDRKALVSGESALLADAVQKWEELMKRRQDCDRRRAVLCDQISTVLGIRPDQLTVTRIAASLPEPLGRQLRRTGTDLRKTATDAALEAAVGEDLLEEAARFHEGLIRQISTAVTGSNPSYGQEDIKPAPGLTLLDATG